MTRAIWLASASPRRRDLLTWAGFDVAVHPPHLDESRHPHEAPVAYAERLAAEKVAGAPVGVVALAADTVVHRGDQLFDKPRDRADARDILARLAGGSHQVTTAVAIRGPAGSDRFHVTTDVTFRPLEPREIADYVASGEADDKAGAYGIQGRAAVFVADVRGSWTNVVGLPVEACLPVLARHLGGAR